MSAGEAAEAVVKEVSIGIRAYISRNEGSGTAFPDEVPTDNVPAYILEVWDASRQEVRPGLAEEILHTVCDEEGRADGQGQTQESDVELPSPPLPYQRTGRPFRYSRAGDEDEADYADDADRDRTDEDSRQAVRNGFDSNWEARKQDALARRTSRVGQARQ